jgi:hypothetical protein
MTAASNADVLSPAEFRIGRVFSRSFGIFGRHFVKFVLLAAITVVPTLFFGWLGLTSVRPAAPGAPPQFSAATVLAQLAAVWLYVFLYQLGHAIILYGAFQDMRGRPFGIGESLGRGLARLLPIIGLAICFGLAVGIATLLLIIPGLIALSMFYVSLPACVVERLGPLKSMSRSARLTKGHRWQILGIYLLLALVVGIISGVLHIVVAPMGIVASIASFVWSSLSGAFGAVVVAVTYHDLRVLKEGVDVEQIAAVFD